MNRGVKVSLVAGVLFGGIALALFFKKDPDDASTADGDPVAETAPDELDLPDLTPQERVRDQRPADGSAAASKLASDPESGRWAKDPPVPNVSPAFEPNSPQPSDSRWSQAAKSDPFSDSPAHDTSVAQRSRTALKYHLDDSARPSADQPARVNKIVLHKIVDGDTLGALALKFYGDATDGGRIFAANRHVLAAPDLLPIGRELRIPPRPTAVVQKRPDRGSDLDGSDLVPVGTK